MRYNELTEAIETKHLYDLCVKNLANAFTKLSNECMTYDDGRPWFPNAISIISDEITKSIDEAKEIDNIDKKHKLYIIVKLSNNNNINGSFVDYNNTKNQYISGSLSIFLPRRWFDINPKLAAHTFANKHNSKQMISFLTKIIVHEYSHFIQAVRANNNYKAYTHNTRSKSMLNKQEEYLAQSIIDDAKDWYTPDDKDRAKFSLYLTKKNEITSWAINAAQELLEFYDNDIDKIKYIFQNRSKMSEIAMSGYVKHLSNFYYIVGMGNHKHQKTWNRFLKLVYLNLIHYTTDNNKDE